MKLKINSLRINNFKGIKELDIYFDGKDMNIEGDNATGKTTINDAFTWLLFGKDSLGNAKFDIKTKDSYGNHIHFLEHSVECVFDNDGIELTFKRVYKEKYTKKHGTSTDTFTGHTTDYFIDEVPKGETEYNNTINNLIDKEMFIILTDPLCFNDDKRFNFDKRRKMLIDICGDVLESDVIDSDSELMELTSLAKGKKIDDFRTILKRKMPSVNEELKSIPIKIKEAQLATPNVTEIDETRYQELERLINEKANEYNNALNSNGVDSVTKKINELKSEKSIIMQSLPELGDLQLKNAKMQTELTIKKQFQNEQKNNIDRLESDIEINENYRNNLRIRYTSVSNSVYDEKNNICPHCGQTMPIEKTERSLEDFNLKKSIELESLGAKGVDSKNKYDEMENSLEESKALESAVSIEIENMNAELSDMKNEINIIVSAFNEENAKKVAVIDDEINSFSNDKDRSYELNRELANGVLKESIVLKEEKELLDTAKANKQQAERQEKRINELMQQEKLLSKTYQDLEYALYLTDKFIKTKVSMISSKINAHFKLCNFKLFEEQINGGVKECCKVTVNGVSYDDLNKAMKINVGLDVINTLCEYKHTFAPIFIDNCEAVNNPIKTESQQIRLYVTKDSILQIHKCGTF